jgi:hypothetical protein
MTMNQTREGNPGIALAPDALAGDRRRVGGWRSSSWAR